MVFERMEFLKNNPTSIPFTSREYFITSHESIYDGISFWLLLRALIKLFWSVVGTIKCDHEKKNDFLVYHGGDKTKLELEKLLCERLDMQTISDKHTRREDSAKRFSSITYLFDKKFIGIFYSLLIDRAVRCDIKLLMVSDLFWNYGYYVYLKHVILDKRNVLSFFSTSQLAIILYEACSDSNKPFIFYTWGSNQGYEEFRYASSNITLVKNNYDFRLFSSLGSYGKVLRFGDLSIANILNIKDSYMSEPAKILIIDTCLSNRVSSKNKYIIYERIFKSLSSISASFTIRPHPATRVEELSELISSINNNIIISSCKSVFDQASDADLVVNINSTVGLQLISLGIPVYEIYDEGYADGYIDEGYPGIIFSQKNIVNIGDRVFSKDMLNEFLLKKGVVPADMSILHGI